MTTALLIALANLKGGCGKSTLALNLASGLSRRNKTILLDADPQGAMQHWADWAPDALGVDVRPLKGDPGEALAAAATDYAYVVVDCPPSIDMRVTGKILDHATHALIPVLPSPLDLWASARAVDAIEKARRVNPSLKAWFLLNQVEQKSALSRATAQALERLPLPLLEPGVRRRAAYRTAILEGKSVYQLGARGEDAVREMETILDEVTRP